ncbi:hypothetical protein DRN97_04180 [Methanosarcinales archaeon]|nr:MAG: hypothetical protein DRN97_04180 [Methanosarcinales archaeon]
MARKKAKKSGKEWKSIKIPLSLYQTITAVASRENTTKYHVIASALAKTGKLSDEEFEELLAKNIMAVDRRVWYSFKLINGFAMFKQLAIVSNFPSLQRNKEIKEYVEKEKKKFLGTIEQVEKRLKVDLSDIRKIVEYISGDNSGTEVAKINDTVKRKVIEILTKVVS